MPAATKILVVDDDKRIRNLLGRKLRLRGYEVVTASDGVEALEKTGRESPDLVILDVTMPRLDGFAVCRQLRESSVTCLIPIVMLTAREQTADRIAGIRTGADEYVTKPFNYDELEARVEGLLRRKQQILSANPLTGLPGNISIEEELKKRISRGGKFAVCYMDIDNFKSYNDQYGYQRGDQVLLLSSRIIVDAVKTVGVQDSFVGHVGGDDFVVITSPGRVDAVAQCIVKSFDELSPSWYDEADRARGHIAGKDRQGNERQFPLMSISIVAVTNEKRAVEHPAQIAETVAELKRYAKTVAGSIYVKDRRESQGHPSKAESGKKHPRCLPKRSP